MFNYNFVKNPWFCNYYTKHLRKAILTSTSLILLLANVFAFSLSFFILRQNEFFKGTVYLSVLAITVILEGIALIFYCNKEVKNTLNKLYDNNLILSFNEDGIDITSDAITKSIKWTIVKEAVATKNELIIYFKVNGIPSNSFLFNFFDASKDDILEALEKHITVRRKH